MLLMWNELLIAVGLLLVLEGIIPFLNPSGLRKTLEKIQTLSDSNLRYLGLGSMILGLLVLTVFR